MTEQRQSAAQQLRQLQTLMMRHAALEQQRDRIRIDGEPFLANYQEKLKPWAYLLGVGAGAALVFITLTTTVNTPMSEILFPVGLAIAAVIIGIVARINGAPMVILGAWIIYACAALSIPPLSFSGSRNTAGTILVILLLLIGILVVATYNSTIPARNMRISEENQERKDAANASVQPQLEQNQRELDSVIAIYRNYQKLVPAEYRNPKTVGKLADYLETGRADTTREALALYDQREHYRKMEDQSAQW